MWRKGYSMCRGFVKTSMGHRRIIFICHSQSTPHNLRFHSHFRSNQKSLLWLLPELIFHTWMNTKGIFETCGLIFYEAKGKWGKPESFERIGLFQMWINSSSLSSRFLFRCCFCCYNDMNYLFPFERHDIFPLLPFATFSSLSLTLSLYLHSLLLALICSINSTLFFLLIL